MIFGKTVLVVGAHPDDEVLGAGGTLATLARDNAGRSVYVALVTALGDSIFGAERALVRYHDALLVAATLHTTLLTGGQSELNLSTRVVADWLRTLVRDLQPDIVLTHSVHDLHEDHRRVAEATMIACRPYEARGVRAVLSYIVDSFAIAERRPLLFSRLSESALQTKVACMLAYRTEVQTAPHPRSPEEIMDRARYFGSLVACDYAEPFDVVWGRIL